MNRYPWAAVWLVAGLAPAWSSAQTATPPPPGRLLASNCFQCHGTNGNGPGFERLLGESSSEIVKDLTQMRSGKEDPGGLMTRHAMGYTDAQMRALATYLASLRTTSR